MIDGGNIPLRNTSSSLVIRTGADPNPTLETTVRCGEIGSHIFGKIEFTYWAAFNMYFKV